jgi:hypothetical protein
MSSRRFVELVVLARRFVVPGSRDATAPSPRATGRRQIGGEVTRFSFRLALMIDLAYVGAGALGGSALHTAINTPSGFDTAVACQGRATHRSPDLSAGTDSAQTAAHR